MLLVLLLVLLPHGRVTVTMGKFGRNISPKSPEGEGEPEDRPRDGAFGTCFRHPPGRRLDSELLETPIPFVSVHIRIFVVRVSHYQMRMDGETGET